MHPSGRLGVLVGKNIRNSSVGVLANAFARCPGKAVANSIVQKAVCIEM